LNSKDAFNNNEQLDSIKKDILDLITEIKSKIQLTRNNNNVCILKSFKTSNNKTMSHLLGYLSLENRPLNKDVDNTLDDIFCSDDDDDEDNNHINDDNSKNFFETEQEIDSF
jgi:hypothetical protein